MKRAITAAAIVGGAAAITGTVLTAAPSLAGNSSTAHTLKFVAVQTGGHQLDKTHFVGSDKDKHNGTVIGFDAINCVVTSPTTGKCNVAGSFKGGILYATFTQSFSTGDLTGHVTGGTRHFKGATGTITGTSAGKNRESVTVHYTT